MENKKNAAFGIDIGGTNTVMAVVSRDGEILGQCSMPTPGHDDFRDYIVAINSKLQQLASDTCGISNIAGIGVGAPNGNFYSGRIDFAPNLPWKGKLPLAETLQEVSGLPVTVTNDANAAAMGEYAYGVAKGMKHFIMITLGTGVGSGIVINGEIVYGHDGFAGELGHSIIDFSDDARPCGCGRKGCLEAYTSATGVARTARQFLSERSDDSLLRKLDVEKITSKDVYDAAIQGDRLALNIYEYTGEILGKAISNFITFSAPEAIVLFGGLAQAGDILLDPIRKAMDKYTLSLWQGKVKLLVSSLKSSNAALLGASALVW
ncbi:MAG: ROK family protein [Bacteroidaceae bacterium]|nr:ROK family protein [Bacteroidaceae bacterium]